MEFPVRPVFESISSEELRTEAASCRGDFYHGIHADTYIDAADTIDALRSELARTIAERDKLLDFGRMRSGIKLNFNLKWYWEHQGDRPFREFCTIEDAVRFAAGLDQDGSQ